MTRHWISGIISLVIGLCAGGVTGSPQAAAQLVPGTGQKIMEVGDDFEDPAWEYIPRLPKSSKNLNNNAGGAGGESKNGRWYEGLKRGQPDVVRRVPTPPKGLPGSTGALELRSLYTGIPGRPSFRLQQDDFICDVNYRLGRTIPVEKSPNVVVRVFMPPVKTWEDRSGPTFAFRAAVDTRRPSQGRFSRSGDSRETYWPGMFIEFDSETENSYGYDAAFFRIRADERGGDYQGLSISETGWWTLGMSFTPDGRVHYYAKPGVEPLTEEDRIASHYPYGYRCENFHTFFFNICNGDDGKTWSTSWIVDDCEVFLATP